MVERTTVKQVRAWNWYKLYLLSIALQDDLYLDSFSRAQKHKILSAFTHPIREGRFGTKTIVHLKSESVRASLDCLAHAFKLAGRADPRLNEDGKLAFLLPWQLRGYSTIDNLEWLQVAITASRIREFYKMSLSTYDRALCELFIGALFFAMCSCEYIQVSGSWKTKLLTIKSIQF